MTFYALGFVYSTYSPSKTYPRLLHLFVATILIALSTLARSNGILSTAHVVYCLLVLFYRARRQTQKIYKAQLTLGDMRSSKNRLFSASISFEVLYLCSHISSC